MNTHNQNNALRLFAKYSLRTLAVAILLLVMLIPTAVILLQTSWAENKITAIAADALETQGIYFKLDKLSGPLPWQINIQGISLADDNGIWCTADELDLKLNLSALLSRTIYIDELNLKHPTLIRMPDLHQETATNNAEEKNQGFDLNLPLKLELEKITIDEARLAWDLVGITSNEKSANGMFKEPNIPDNAQASSDQAPNHQHQEQLGKHPLLLDLSGKASLHNGQLDGTMELTAHSGPELALTLNLAPFNINMPGADEAAINASATLTATAGKQTGEMQIKVSGAQSKDQLDITELSIAGLDLDFKATGNLNTDSRAAKFTFDLASKSNAEWQHLVKTIAGFDPTLLAALANPLNIEADLSGGGNENYLLDIKTLKAGVISGKGSLEAGEEFLFAEHPQNKNSLLKTRLNLEASEIEAFDLGISGPLAALLNVEGNINTIGGTLALSSLSLHTAAGKLENLDLQLTADADPWLNGLQAKGTLKSRTTSGPSGPVEIDTTWALALPAPDKTKDNGSLKLENFSAKGFGVSMSGNIDATLGPALLTGTEQEHTIIWPSDLGVAGQINAEATSFAPLGALLGIQMRGSKASANIELNHATSGQTANISIDIPALSLPQTSGININGLSAKAGINFKSPYPDIDIELSAKQGQAGSLYWSGVQGFIKGTGQSGDFSLNMQEANRSKTKSANLHEILAANGDYNLADSKITIAKLNIQDPLSTTQASIANPVSITYSPGLEIRELNLILSPEGSITANATASPGKFMAEAEIKNLPLSFISHLTGASLPAAKLNAQLSAKENASSPQGTFNAELYLDKPQSNRTPAVSSNTSLEPDLSINGNLGRFSGRLCLQGNADFAHMQTMPELAAISSEPPFTFRIPLYLENSGLPMPDLNAPVHAALKWSGPINPLWRLAAMPDRELSGLVSFDLMLKGSLNKPVLRGTAYMAKARFEDKAMGVLLTDIDLEAKAMPNETFLIVLSAADGGKGRAAMAGILHTKTGLDLNMRGQLNHLAPLYRDDIDLTLSGLINTEGPLSAPKITASILIERGELTLLSTLGAGAITTLEISDPDETVEDKLNNSSSDIRIDIPRHFFVRGRGLDSEWQGNLHITGPIDKPALTGSLRPVRGTFELLTKSFSFKGGNITFTGSTKINPAINLELAYARPALEAIIKAKGNLEKPKITLESLPPVPQDEVLAQVLFGKNLSDLSRFESLQLASSLRQLSGNADGGLNPLTTMREATGFDVLRVGTSGDDQQTRHDSGLSGAQNIPGQTTSQANSEDAATTLEAGKYINDSIYVGVEKGASQEDTAVRVEIELFPNVTLQGSSSPESSRVGAGWKMDY